MEENKKYEAPKPGTGDALHAIARSGLGSIPVAGAAATELLNILISPPLENRRIKWMEKVGEALRKLESEKGLNLEKLRTDDLFIDITLQATQVAIRTSNNEKRKLLLNSILNSTFDCTIEESMRIMFINFIDYLSPWHLKLLEFFQGPKEWCDKHDKKLPNLAMGGLATILEAAFPELKGKRDFYDQLAKDIFNRGLLSTDNLHVTMTGSGLLQKRTAKLGDDFLLFIKDPF